MPFFWKPKEGGKKRTKHPPEHIRAAVLSVVNEQNSVRGSAKDFNIDRKTLERYVKKYRLSENKDKVSFKPNYNTGQVFSDEFEVMLADYLKLAAKLHYGLSQKTVRSFAYEFGRANKIKMPDNWEQMKKASYDWVRGFMHRNSRLSLRTPRSTSLSRATAFNRHTVGEFFDNLKTLMSKHKFEAHSIYNEDRLNIINPIHDQPTGLVSIASTSADPGPGLQVVSPEMVRPFPKADARKNTKKGRKPGKTLILTSTPVKEEIERKHARRLAKRKAQESKKAVKTGKLKKTEAKRKLTRKLKYDDDSTDQSEDMGTDYSDIDNDLEDFHDLDLEMSPDFCLSVGDFVLVKFCTKQTTAHFAGRISIIDSCTNEYEVSFLRKKDSGTFSYPDQEDRSVVSREDIAAKLPPPISSGGTERVALKISFDFDFSKFEKVK